MKIDLNKKKQKIKQESENGLSVIFARLVSIWYRAPYEKEISGVYFIFFGFLSFSIGVHCDDLFLKTKSKRIFSLYLRGHHLFVDSHLSHV